jgi:SsrA-binding protein
MKTEKEGVKIVARNRKAHHRFAILESFEAGISLFGHEVKSLRQGRANIEDGLVRADGGELFLFNVHIPQYSHLSHVEYEPTRTRKLLMHRREIDRLAAQIQTKGMTMVPLELYFKNGLAKVTVGLAKGKNTEDRREEIKKRDTDREIRRAQAR